MNREYSCAWCGFETDSMEEVRRLRHMGHTITLCKKCFSRLKTEPDDFGWRAAK